jgi:Zn-dependent protease
MNIDILYIAIVIVVILLSMTLHEAMHAFMGYWLGDDTAKAQGRLTLNPIKHIDPFLTIVLPVMLAITGLPIFGGAKPVPFNPQNVRWGEWGAALVALAGPLTNLILAFILFGVGVLVGVSGDSIWYQVLQIAILVNLGFFIFNIIPIPPLDGSRVLYALAPEFVRRGMETIERYGIIVVFAIILLAGPSLGIFLRAAINFFLAVFGHIFIR